MIESKKKVQGQFTENQQEITIRFDSYDKKRILKPKNFIERFSYDLNLNIGSLTHLKKKSKQRVTILSGPHVHKKSRQQFRIDLYSAFFVIKIPYGRDCGRASGPSFDKDDNFKTPALSSQNKLPSSKNAYTKFLDLKRKLYVNHIDEGLDITFRYLKRETITL